MATFRIPILGFGTAPDDSGDVWFEPYDIKATNDVWKRLVGVFDDPSADEALYGGFTVPKNYVGTPKIVIVWTSTATSGTCKWSFDYRAVGGDDTESLDQDTAQQTVTCDDVAPSAIHERMEISTALTAGNFAADDEVKFILWRDLTGDTMAAAALLFALIFEYTDA